MDIKKAVLFKNTLEKRKLKIACAESITAGLLASTIASVSGASQILRASIVTYNEEIKTLLLHVRKETLKEKTAESGETTKEMLLGLIEMGLGADIYVTVTGAASAKDPNSNYRQVAEQGQIYVAIQVKDDVKYFDFRFFDTERNIIREKTVDFILDKILEMVEKLPIN